MHWTKRIQTYGKIVTGCSSPASYWCSTCLCKTLRFISSAFKLFPTVSQVPSSAVMCFKINSPKINTGSIADDLSGFNWVQSHVLPHTWSKWGVLFQRTVWSILWVLSLLAALCFMWKTTAVQPISSSILLPLAIALSFSLNRLVLFRTHFEMVEEMRYMLFHNFSLIYNSQMRILRVSFLVFAWKWTPP